MKIEVPGKTLKQITKLDLSNRNLKIIPEDVFKCTNLTKLIISHNSISKIPREISALRKLKVLDISHNKLNTLYTDVFNLTKLLTLNISNNNIKVIPRQIATSPIKNLLIQNNKVLKLSEDIVCNLEKLNVSHNNLSEFMINQKTAKLKQLWISDNPIKKLQIEKHCIPELKIVYAFTQNTNLDIDNNYKKLALISGNSINVLYKFLLEHPKSLNKNKSPLNQHNEIIKTGKNKNPKVFISYSWDDERHKDWVRIELADKLIAKGIDIILDQYDVDYGTHLTRFMENGIEDSDKILVVLTPNYKLKSRASNTGTAFEESIITSTLFEDIDAKKILTILRIGDKKTSCPYALKGINYIDMRDDNKNADIILEVKNAILGIPKYKKPKLGSID